jgi:hypothetical protein
LHSRIFTPIERLMWSCLMRMTLARRSPLAMMLKVRERL